MPRVVREKQPNLELSTHRSVVGAGPPSTQLLEHRESLPTQLANCKGFV